MRAHKFNNEWFKQQFGNPSNRSVFDIASEISHCEYKLSLLKKELRDVELYNAKEDAALKSFVNTIYQIKKERGGK
jgi:hypothetical protein